MTAIQDLANAVKDISDSNFYEYNAIALVTGEIARFVRMHDDVQLLMFGIIDLVEGRLSHKLIHPELMESAVSSMITGFRRGRGSSKMLCYALVPAKFGMQRVGHLIFRNNKNNLRDFGTARTYSSYMTFHVYQSSSIIRSMC